MKLDIWLVSLLMSLISANIELKYILFTIFVIIVFEFIRLLLVSCAYCLLFPCLLQAPAPSVCAFKPTSLYLESDPEFHLCPLTRHTICKDHVVGVHANSTQKTFLCRDASSCKSFYLSLGAKRNWLHFGIKPC